MKKQTIGSVAQLLSLVSILLILSGTPGSSQPMENLPHGTNGIASKYPGDSDLRSDPSVVFVEHFQARNKKQIFQRWETVQNGEYMTLSDDVPGKRTNDRSLRIEHVGKSGAKTVGLYRRLKNQNDNFGGFEKLFLRMYVKFAEDCYSIHHLGTHLGGYNPTTSYPQGGAGERPTGDDRFTVHPEPRGKTGEPWHWAWYNYWCEMRGSPPNGKTWGNSFMRPEQRPEVTRGGWQCIEIMIKLNDVGSRNGELALWVDGEPVSYLKPGYPTGTWIWDSFHPGKEGPGITWDNGRKEILGNQPFQGFRWRTDESLTISHVWPYVYITKAPEGYKSRIWFDQIVVAKNYIGPKSEK